MEDSNKMKAQPKDAPQDKGRVIDLTPEMEKAAGARVKIIELTQAFEPPADKSAPSMEPAIEPSAESAAQPAMEPETAAPDAHHPPGRIDVTNIEADIDAAFDAMEDYNPPQPSDDAAVALSGIAEPEQLAPSTTDPELELTMDELVDDEPWNKSSDTASDNAAGTAPGDAPLNLTDVVRPIDLTGEAQPVESMDENRPSASFDASTTDETPDEILELSDAVDMGGTADAQDEEETIDLNDIVPAHETAAAEEQDEIIELIEIVGPDELAAIPDEEEEMIDLTDAVPGQETAAEEQDEVLELTEIIDPDKPATIQDEEEDVIDLTDVAQSDASDADAETAQDEAIELTEAVDPDETAVGYPAEAIEPADAGRPDDRPEQAPAPADLEGRTDEAAIELSNPVEGDASFSAPQPPEPADDEDRAGRLAAANVLEDGDADLDDQVIRLDSVLNHLRKNKNKLERDITLEVEEELFNTASPVDDQAKQSDTPPVFAVDPEMERAVEKILTTKYAHTIEEIIAKTVERVVTREIENIKRNLMEDED